MRTRQLELSSEAPAEEAQRATVLEAEAAEASSSAGPAPLPPATWELGNCKLASAKIGLPKHATEGLEA